MINLMYFPKEARGIIGSFVVTGSPDCINISVVDDSDQSESLVSAVRKVSNAKKSEVNRALFASTKDACKKELAAMCDEVVELYPDNKLIFEIFTKLKTNEIL